MSKSLKTVIYEFYEALSAGKFDGVAELLDEKVDLVCTAPVELFPYLGHRVGKSEVLNALQTLHKEFAPMQEFPVWVVTSGDSAGALVSIAGTQRSSGRLIRVFAAHFMRFHDERIIEIRSVVDWLDAVRQILGREIDLTKEQAPSHRA